MSGRQRTVAATLALLLTVSIALGGALVVGASHDSAANYTVALPSEQDHYPGDQNGASASIWHLAALGGVFEGTPSPKGFEEASYLVIESSEIDFSQCRTQNTAAFGVDRGNDDPNTQTDDGLLKHREDSQFNTHSIVVKFFDGDSLAGAPVSINAEDQIVAVQNDCYTMPTEPGWYQIHGSLNGTGYNGNFFQTELSSHYFYICECASEEEARSKLGPPPSESSGSGSGSGSGATATPTPKDSSTPEPKSTPQSGSGGTATPDSSSDATPDAATATPGDPQSGSNGTATASGGGGNAGGDGNTGDQNQQSDGTQAPNDGGPMTPTAGSGPGFGAVGALLALIGAALLVGRRG